MEHRYDTTSRFRDPESTLNRVVRMVGCNRRVLDVGCGPGTTARALAKNGCAVTAVDSDPSALALAAGSAVATFQVDLDSATWTEGLLATAPFDVVVLADVLEHVRDPARTLAAAAELLDENGRVVISLPNAGHNAVLALLWLGDFQYRNIGLLDDTHVRFFCARNIEPLLQTAGLRLQQIEFVLTHPRDSEYADEWYQLPIGVRRSLSANRYGNVYQFVLSAGRPDAAAAPISMDDVQVPRLPASALVELRRALGRAARRVGLFSQHG